MSKFITPTEQNPIFMAAHSDFGYIETTLYKQWEIKRKSTYIGGYTFALNFKDAVNLLHEYIQANRWLLDGYPTATFEIYIFKGQINKWDETVLKKVYSITAKKAKELL